MKKQIPKDKLILFGLPIIGLFVGMISYFMLVSPQKSAAAHLDSQIQDVQAQIAAANIKPPKPKPAHAVDLFRLTKAMPDVDDMPGIVFELSRVARASSVALESVKPVPRIPMAVGYAAIPVEVTVSGKYPEITRFLQGLREQVAEGKKGGLRVQGRLFVANQVDISTDTGKKLLAKVSLNAFVYGVTPPVLAPVGPTGAAGASGAGGAQ
ncbi:MAG: Pilus assembly protein PilO [Gaiellaceae bacterium]|nr:Pilus assembly protein PilO [Gaiellaceae bacterium]